MYQEEKNARNLRLRERRKNKGARCIPKLWCYKYITCNNGCNLDGSRFQGSYKFVGHFNIFLFWFWSMFACHDMSKRIRVSCIPLVSQNLVRVLLLFILIMFVQTTICRGGWCIER